MSIATNEPCNCELKDFAGMCPLRIPHELSQTQMEIPQDVNGCCAINLLVYLCYHCKNVPAALDGCRKILDQYYYVEHHQQ